MATAVTAINTDEAAVRTFLRSLFHKTVLLGGGTAAAGAPLSGAAAAGAPISSTAWDGSPLKLHPRVDAAHPLVSYMLPAASLPGVERPLSDSQHCYFVCKQGTAHTAEELETALKLYSQMVTSE